jgi:2-amino-4-hydroxy-6-hydroxymethyldihydropteridine diphosphokinase
LLATLAELGRVGCDLSDNVGVSGGLVTVEDTSRLYETVPMYVEAQPHFLNAVCKVVTRLEPASLLAVVKRVEASLGRRPGGARHGPRPIDIDIVLFGRPQEVKGRGGGVSWDEGTWRAVCDDRRGGLVLGDLTLPHPRFTEREFVLRPLLDLLDPGTPLPLPKDQMKPDCNGSLPRPRATTLGACLEALGGPSAACVPVLPLGKRLLPLEEVTPSPATTAGASSATPPAERSSFWRPVLVMGILNATPDSFSDGGRGLDADPAQAVARGLELAAGGAVVVDVGGESTRPGAAEVPTADQVARVAPVITALREALDNAHVGAGTAGVGNGDGDATGSQGGCYEWGGRGVVISVDTRSAAVARAAVAAGAGMVNDVSGGRHDPAMRATVAELGVPFVCVHSRGNPQTMRSLAM